MRERNIDKVRRMERELSECRSKSDAQIREIVRLHKRLGEAGPELSRLAEALYIGVALKFGTEVSPGVWEIVLPRQGDVLERYRLYIEPCRDGQYRYRVTERDGR